jgi:hypothetical protein
VSGDDGNFRNLRAAIRGAFLLPPFLDELSVYHEAREVVEVDRFL